MTAIKLPRGFNLWVLTSVGFEFGSGVLSFALTWVASGHGPTVAAGVLVVTVAPSVLLSLLGGAVADRYGPRRVMIVGALGLMAVSGGLALAVTLLAGSPPILLLIAATLIGVISAFHRPAGGVFARLFVDDNDLGAAMARAGLASQVARTIAPPLGGLLIGMISLNGIALLDVLGCVAMVITLTLIRPPLERSVKGEAVTLRAIGQGISTAGRTPGVRTLLLCMAIVAGAVIPAVVLGIPLAARERGWSAAQAGLIEAGWIAGGILGGAWFAWRGTAVKVWRPMSVGPLVVAAGLGLLAVSPNWIVAAGGTVAVGLGVVVFTAHLFPTYVALAPSDMMSRFQSLLILVQQAPQLVMIPLIGFVVSAVGAGPMIGTSAALAVLASLVAMQDRTLRGFTDHASD